jgi:hypothetical protein
MGDYCEVADVQAQINTITNGGFTITTTSQPTIIRVDLWIDSFEARINAALAKCGYAMPATGASDIAILRDIVAEYVVAKVWEVVFTDVEEPAKVARWRQQGLDALKEMKTCDFVLVDQTFVRSKGMRVFYSRVTTDDDV